MTRLIGAPLSDAERETIRATAMSLLGTPWRHMGRLGCGYGHQTGLDCAGAIVRLVLSLDRPVGDIDLYERTGDGRVLLANLDAHLGERLPASQLAAWQIVHIPFGKSYQHIALTLPGPDEQLYLWHSYNGLYPAGRVMWHRIDERWRRLIKAGWVL